MGGKSTTTSVTNVPPPSEAELAMQGKQLDLAALQIGAIKDQTLMQWQQFNAAGPVLEQQSQLLQKQLELLNSPEAQQYQRDALALQQRGMSAQDAQLALLQQQVADYNSPEAVSRRAKEGQLTDIQLDQAMRLAPMQEELARMQLDEIKRGGRATDEQKALIAAATDAAISAGTSDINKFQLDALRQIRDEYAPSAGLRPTDTPVLDRAARVASEATRQAGQLSTNLRGAQATAELNFPLAQSQMLAGINAGQQGLLSATQNFQQQLAQAAQQNRMALYGGAGNFSANSANLGSGLIAGGIGAAQNYSGGVMGGGLGLATGIPGGAALASALQGMRGDRYASASQTSTTSTPFNPLSIIGGIGGLASGLSGLGWKPFA